MTEIPLTEVRTVIVPQPDGTAVTLAECPTCRGLILPDAAARHGQWHRSFRL